MVAGTWARGHAKRGPAETRVEPLSDEEIDGAADGWADLGEITLDDVVVPSPSPAALPRDPDIPASGAAGDEPDEPPAHASKARRKAARAAGREPRAAAKIRVTVSVRADITAKIAMPLEIGGQIWRARDPLCGTVFLEQRAPIAEALADIVCDSPDLVAFFTGPGGAFMRYLNLAAALWPVLEVLAAHHVWHTVEIAPDGAEGNADSLTPQYAA